MSFVFFIIIYTTSYTVSIYKPKDVCVHLHTQCTQYKKIHSILFCHFSLLTFDLTHPSLNKNKNPQNKSISGLPIPR